MKQLLFIFTLLLNITISTSMSAKAGFNQLKTLPPTSSCPPCQLEVRGFLTKVTHPLKGDIVELKLVALTMDGRKISRVLDETQEQTVLSETIYALKAYIVAKRMTPDGIKIKWLEIPKENLSGSADPGGDEI